MHQQQKTLRLVLGDQLNENHPWLEQPDKNITYVMMYRTWDRMGHREQHQILKQADSY